MARARRVPPLRLLSRLSWPQPRRDLSHARICPVWRLRSSALRLALPAAAEEVPTLTIYTYDSFAAEWGPGPRLKAGFEKTCGCTVEFVATDSSIGALRRVQLEGATTEADIVLGLDTAIAGEARATGLFAPHGLDLSGSTLPLPWTDPDFVPFDYGYFAFVYDKDRCPTPPSSFEELIAMPDDFKIVIEDPRSDTPGPRPRALDRGALRRPGGRDLGRPQAAHPHRRARLVGGLRACSSRARPTWC